MFSRILFRLGAVFFLLGFAHCSYSATLYNEAISGDLSNSGLSPTPLSLGLGANQIFGTTGRTTAVDRDYFTVSVPPGWQISSIVELANTQIGDAFSFLGIQTGHQVTLPASATTANGLLGWTHYGPLASDTNILPEIAVAALGSSGFAPPLGSGDYSFWIQDFGAGTFAYAFDIQTSPTPEPATMRMSLLAGGFLAAFGWRKRYR